MHARGPLPYLLLPGTAREALGFWCGVFGGEVQVATFGEFGRTDGPADAVAHGVLAGDVALFAADAGTEDAVFVGSGLLLSLLGAASPSVLRRWFAALAEGGTVIDPLQQRPWGDWDGQVRDRFGVVWLLGFELSAAD